jgi:hypothetical protein
MIDTISADEFHRFLRAVSQLPPDAVARLAVMATKRLKEHERKAGAAPPADRDA